MEFGLWEIYYKEILEDLGPTFIKIGQILSNRPDMLSKAYIEELSKLRSEVSPMNYQEVLNTLNNEYDKKLFQLFVSIEREPLGSASIAQVHKAVLKDGTDVVIKVQRSNIKEIMITDIKVLKKALKMLHVEKILKNIVSFDDVLDELLYTTYNKINEDSDENKDFLQRIKPTVELNRDEIASFNEYPFNIEIIKNFKKGSFES